MSLSVRNIVVLTDVKSLDDSMQLIGENYKISLDDLTIIDTVRDFNQNKWLGQELSNTLIYINPQTRINSILSVTGCVKGGCFLVFAFEAGTYFPFFRDYFIPRLAALVNKVNMPLSSELSPYSSSYLEADAITRLFSKSKILHIVGSRGTGKSTLLGNYILSLFKHKEPYPHVVLISPSKKSSENTFKQIKNVSRETFAYIQPHLVTQQCLEQSDFVMVDEAASLSRELIQAVKKHAKSKVIFSTTIDGYESTGQSYRLENLVMNDELEIRLEEPKRFIQNDAVHQFIQEFCHPKKSNNNLCMSNGVFSISDIDVPYDEILTLVFSLLQQAHYRTTPNDFASLYDTKGILMLSVYENKAVGALHAIPERLGSTDTTFLQQIFYGKRRVKNAMTQQQIINAYGVIEIADKKILRISRIAVEEKHRRKRFGGQLIKELEIKARGLNYDFLSTSFSYQPKTYAFWESQGFVPVLVGINKNKWHNSFSVVMLKSLHLVDLKNNELLKNVNKLFKYHVWFYKNSYTDFLSLAGKALIENAIMNEDLFSQNIKKELDSVLNNHRDINWALPRIYRERKRLNPEFSEITGKVMNGKLLDKIEKKKLVEQLRDIT